MDELQDMDFEGGIDSLDLSSVGNAEEVGASALLPAIKSVSDRRIYGTVTEGVQPNLSCGLHGAHNASNRSQNDGQGFGHFGKSNYVSDVSGSHARKSPENVDIGMDFDVDSFLNTDRKTQDTVDKVSTVIHYVPATEISCCTPSNSGGDGQNEIMLKRGACSGDEDEMMDNESCQKYSGGSCDSSPEISTKVVSVNNLALYKQNLMATDLLPLCSVANEASPCKTLSSRLIPGRGLVLGISCKPAGNVNDQTDGSGQNDAVQHLDEGTEKTQTDDDNEVEISVNEVHKNTASKYFQNTEKSNSGSEEKAKKNLRSTAHKENTLNSHKENTLNLGQKVTQMVEYNIHIDDTQKIKDDEGNTKWSCNICSGTYSSRHNLVTHILSHNNIRPHYCLVCGKMFRQLSHLQTHLLTHGNNRPHVCHVCKRAFTQLSHLKRHLITHQDLQTISCKFCGRGFAYTSELKAHEAKHEQAKAKSCSDCGSSFDTNRKLKHHIATAHSKSKDLTCTECNKVFNYPSQLRDHLLKHTGKRDYCCDKCDMKFMKEHHLRAHQITHTGVKPYSCPTCSRSFNQQGNLQRHMLIHSQEKLFKCTICDKSFAQQQVLNTHMLTHSTEKPYKCTVCGKGFTRAHNLKAHHSMHKDKKPHVCLCGASFTVKGNLNRHRKQYHGLCGKISMEEEAAFILKSMSTKANESKKSGPESNTEQNYEPTKP